MVGLDKKSESNPFTSLKALTKARLETTGAAKHTLTKASKVTMPPNVDDFCFFNSPSAARLPSTALRSFCCSCLRTRCCIGPNRVFLLMAVPRGRGNSAVSAASNWRTARNIHPTNPR